MATIVQNQAATAEINLPQAAFRKTQSEKFITFCNNHKQSLRWTVIALTVTIIFISIFKLVKVIKNNIINPPADLNQSKRFFVPGSKITASEITTPDKHQVAEKGNLEINTRTDETEHEVEHIALSTTDEDLLDLDIDLMNSRCLVLQKIINKKQRNIDTVLRLSTQDKLEQTELAPLVGDLVYKNIVCGFFSSLTEITADDSTYDAGRWNTLMRKHCIQNSDSWNDNQVLALGELFYDLHTHVELQKKLDKSSRYKLEATRLGHRLMIVNPKARQAAAEVF
jgi:hypothetical protein